MGAKQSKGSVDITTTPKKEGIPAEGGVVVGDAAAPGDGKLERIEETDTKPTTNGIAPHTDVAEDKDKDKDDATEKDNEKQQQQPQQQQQQPAEEAKAEETKQESTGEAPAEAASPNTATSPDSKETKKKDKPKKKWSFRSISFSRKDKSKPTREEAPKNGDVTKEEPLAEGGEEAENASATAGSPVEDKSSASSPSAENEVAPVPASAASVTTAPSAETKEDAVATSGASSPADEKKEEPTPSAPTPVPVEDKKEEVEKVEAEKKVVEVSPAGGQSITDPVEVSVFRVQPVATPSIIERKTSEDIPSLPPSSPPPTPIDPSPLQQAQQAAVATATALAEALKLPAEAAGKELDASTVPPESPKPSGSDEIVISTTESLTTDTTTTIVDTTLSLSKQDSGHPTETPRETFSVSHVSPVISTDEKPREATVPVLSAKVEALPVVDVLEKKERPSSKVEVVELGSGETTKSLNVEEKVTGERNVDEIVKVEATLVDNEVESPIVAIKEDLSSSLEKEEEDGKAEKRNEPPQEALVKDVETIVQSSVIKVEKMLEIPSNVVAHPKPESIEELVISKVVLETSMASPEKKTVTERPVETLVEQKPVEPVILKSEEVVVESVEKLIEPEIKVEKKETEIEKPKSSTSELVLDSEEGPVPISEEILVEAKPAMVIPEDEGVEEAVDSEAVDTESVEVIEEAEEDKFENETESDTALVTEEILVHDESEDLLVPEDTTVETCQRKVETVKKIEEKEEVVEELEDSVPPPPLPASPMPCLESSELEKSKIEAEPVRVASPVVEVESVSPSSPTEVEKRQDVEESPPLPPPEKDEEIEAPKDSSSSLSDVPVPPQNSLSRVSAVVPESSVVNEKDASRETRTDVPPSRLEDSPVPSDDLLPPAPRDDETVESLDSSEYPLPPEELSCRPSLSSNMSEITSQVPVNVESTACPRNPTETLLTPPRSPSPRSNVSIESSRKECSQTDLQVDDQSNREFKMESVSISLNSYNESEIELKERLAESLAETENQEESFSCQLSNSATSTAAQEIHQSTPEPEAPVENNVAHEVSTTESSDDAPKVAPPAVPTEVVPPSPPSAPAITEDVASVTKAIEENEISDKAIAAATMECNTNEIIADAHHQNNINE